MQAHWRVAASLLTLFSGAAQAQDFGGFPHTRPPGLPPGGYARPYPPRPAPPPYGPGFPGWEGYGGCFGCSYSGDYYGSNVAAPRPAPPLRLQGQWRNGLWYY